MLGFLQEDAALPRVARAWRLRREWVGALQELQGFGGNCKGLGHAVLGKLGWGTKWA